MWLHLLDSLFISWGWWMISARRTCNLHPSYLERGIMGECSDKRRKEILSYYCRMNKNLSPLYEYVLRDLSRNYSLNESVEFLQMNKNHSPLYENGLRDLSRTFSLNESDNILKLTFKACNTDPYVSLTLLHAVVRWKGLVNRVRVPCVLCLLPPGVVHGTKLGDVLCWDFALLVVMGCWLTGARPDSITAGVPVHGRVRRRRNVW